MQAQSADGVIHDFPDETNMSVVDSVMKSYATKGAQPAPDPLADSEGHLIDNPEQALKQGAAFAQSAWARLSGTDRPAADTGDSVDTVDTRDTIAPGLRNALAPAANTTYGSILPFARDQDTGDVRLALPSSLRDLATGGLDLLEGPTTGTVTPAATSLLANVAISGGLNPSPARGTGAAIRDTAELGAPAADLYRPRITATEVQARDGVGIMEAWNRAHAENNAAAIAKIGQATDINEAIAAAGKAAEAPPSGAETPPATSGFGDLFSQPAAGSAQLDALDTQAAAEGWRRMGPNEPLSPGQEVATGEGGRQYVRDAGGGAAGPQSAGAAASRDMTNPNVADISTADMKANRRVAEMDEILRPPQANDTMIYVPGSFPTLAERSGDPVLSQYENLLRQRKADQFVGDGKVLTENNKARIAEFDSNTIPDTTLNSMRRDRDARFTTASDDILPNAKPVDLTPTLDWVQEQLGNPRIQENDAVRSVLEDFLDRILDDGGNLKTDPAAVWGMHDHLQNLLAKAKDPLNATGAEKFAQSHILKMKQLVDQAMNVSTDNRFQSALDRYAEDSKAINAGVIFNDFRPKLTNMSGDLQAANFHNFVKGLAKERGDPGIDPSMDISDKGMRSMINIDTDLKRAGLIRLGAAAGSPTNLLSALAEKAGLDAAHSVVGALPYVGPALNAIPKYLADRKLINDTAKHLAPPEGGYTYPEPGH
jgi:hypothetical protein